MDNLPLQKIAISGPTLASLLQSFSSSLGDVDGLLFGHVTLLPSTLTDDSDFDSSASPHLVATVTSFICPTFPLSFYDSLGHLDSSSLCPLLSTSDHLLGWFSGRRKTPPRPSLREFSVTRSLSTKSDLSFPVKNSDGSTPLNITPCVFLLLTNPLPDQSIHTHEYRAFQFNVVRNSFEPKSIDVVNIGPGFRANYGAFCPNSGFPMLNCEFRGSMIEDRNEETLKRMKQESKDQKELDMYAEGFGVGSLSRLIGPEAANYTSSLENLYEKMLVKIESLAKEVQASNMKVLEQENHNRKLRYRIGKGGVEQ